MTPQVLGTLSTTFRIFDFCTFYIGFPSYPLRELLSGSEGAYISLVGIQTAQYTTPPSFLQKYAFWRFPIFQNQENSRKTSRKGPYTLLWSLKGPSTTLVGMQTAQDTSVSIFFVTDVRHAFVTVYILLESENSRKSSGKPYFTAGLGVRIQPRTLWWISILFRTPWQPHSESGGTLFVQKMPVSALQGTVTHASPPPPPNKPLPTPIRSIQRLLGQPSQMNN